MVRADASYTLRRLELFYNPFGIRPVRCAIANELQITNSITYSKNGVATFSRSISGVNANVSGNGMAYGVLSIATTDTTLQLFGITGPFGWAWFKNLDATNFVQVRVAAAGNKVIKLLPGEAGLVRLGTDITAPVAIADTAAVLLEYALFPP